MLTTSRHRTSKYVFSTLTRLGLRPHKGKPPLRVLEVGAVNKQLMSVPWLEVRAIDLRSTDPAIEQIDFFDLEPKGEYEVSRDGLCPLCRAAFEHLDWSSYMAPNLGNLCSCGDSQTAELPSCRVRWQFGNTENEYVSRCTGRPGSSTVLPVSAAIRRW